ncbi:MAG: hypothetical protein PHY92_04890 [Alphaproteobacteria bacterium]|nr:hypothetical protein [Alphaproteobacteria bacterium]
MRSHIVLAVLALMTVFVRTPSAVAADGAGSYTAWGTTTCASGWSVAYTGVGLFPALGTISPTVSNAICSAVTTGSGGGVWGTWTNSVTDGHISLPCAVCVKN